MNKNLYPTRLLLAMLIVAFSAQAPMVKAEIVATEEIAATQSQADRDRTRVESFMERANVKERLQAMGVSGVFAKDRVESLNQQEIHALAQRIESMPAGGALSNTDLILILLVAILVVIAL